MDSDMEDTFRFFIRMNWKKESENLTNADIDKLGVEFKKYLDNRLSNEAKDKIIPKGPLDVITNSENPLRINGFHPAYKLHFIKFSKSLNNQP